jgi:hypothetical protein
MPSSLVITTVSGGAFAVDLELVVAGVFTGAVGCDALLPLLPHAEAPTRSIAPAIEPTIRPAMGRSHCLRRHPEAVIDQTYRPRRWGVGSFVPAAPTAGICCSS